ncbi:MAG: hypothetical protein MZU95_09495 [Desulfomicrobium escambiense]|nr:hypothetical protein [Desulfomicrobium escambiense]
MEARLLAKGERLDAGERQLRTRGERLDSWQRRLDARAERLDLMEKRAVDQKQGVEGDRPAPAPVPVAPKDKAVFVMVVKSPTAVMKEPAARPAGRRRGRAEAVHPGVAVEKAVAAATVVTFPRRTRPALRARPRVRSTASPAWRRARAASCSSGPAPRIRACMARGHPARRRRSRAASSARPRCSPRQVVTRITTRARALAGVDVVVSALREAGKARPGQPLRRPPGRRRPARRPTRLVGGETDAAARSATRCVARPALHRGLRRRPDAPPRPGPRRGQRSS